MNNHDAIKYQWSPTEMARYPHLFNFVVDMMKKGITAEEQNRGTK